MPDATLYIRVKKSLNWLKRKKGILQKDIADKMGMAESSFTRALARIKEKNDEDFVISYHAAVSKFISLDFLLYGEGSMLTFDAGCEEMEHEIKETKKLIDGFDSPNQTIDQSSLVNAALAAKDETIRSKEETIESLRETIESLKRENSMLRQQISVIQSEYNVKKHPFTVGVAENDDKSINTRV